VGETPVDQVVSAVSAADTAWVPILEADDCARAAAAVAGLRARVDAARRDDFLDPSLSAGCAGVAVFYGELARLAAAADVAAEAWLDRAGELLASSMLGASLYAGFPGIGWAADVLAELRGRGDEDVVEEIDAAVLQVLDRVDWDEAHYDLVFGLTGLGVYALQRLPRPAAAASLERVVVELARIAREDERGAYWWTPPPLLLGPHRTQYPDGGVNLGVAHGMPAVIALLAQAHGLGLASDAQFALARRGVEWLLAHAVEAETGPTMPYFVAANAKPGPARLAWCYGDPGVAAALVAAGQDADQPAWIDAALELALVAAARPPEQSGVTDAGLCHGSAGLGHLFNRIYQTTREPWLLETARSWFEHALRQLEDDEAPFNGLGILEGATGVALALLAATREVEPLWDRMFLVAPATHARESQWAEPLRGNSG
jgi:lantibiotic biosynthesis protein